MWIDTHCHLDASEFGGTSLQLAQQAVAAGVSQIVMPAVHLNLFNQVQQLAQQHAACVYALGIHPMYVPTSDESHLQILRQRIEQVLSSEHAHQLVAVGEIGLDYFVPALTQSPLLEKQEFFYTEQLKIARDFDLPVLLHVRRSQDKVLKHLRRIRVRGGIAHAFNGSVQQAGHFLDLGCKLGFGGAMTFTRALQIRRLAAELPLDALVLETDAPDIPPSWIREGYNRPDQIPAIGAVLAELRAMDVADIAAASSRNAREVLPRLLLN